jgi:hypothetical protein
MPTPSELIDEQISKLQDWRGQAMSDFRNLVAQVAPELKEEWKWNTGIWTYNTQLVIAFSSFKDHVKFNFFRGSELDKHYSNFNNGLDSKHHRSIDIFKPENMDKTVLAEIIRAAVELEKQSKTK